MTRDPASAQPGRRARAALSTLKVVVAALLVSLLAALTLVNKANPDIWFHLKTGEVISATHAVPTRDIFSFTAEGARWVTHEWLSEVLLFLAYRVFSTAGLAALAVLLVLGTAAVIFLNAVAWSGGRRHTPVVLVCGLLWLMALSSWDTFVIRPHLIAWIWMGLFLNILERFRQRKLRSLTVLVPLQLIWANMHGFAVFGPVLIAVFWLGEVADRHRAGEAPGGIPHGRYLITLGLSSATLFLTPNTVYMVLQPLTLMSTSAYQLNEWKSPFSSFYRDFFFLPYFKGWLLIVIVSFLANPRKARAADALLAILFLALPLRSQRHIPLSFIVLIPVVARNFTSAVETLASGMAAGRSQRMKAWPAFSGATALALALVTAFQVRGIAADGLAKRPQEEAGRISLEIDQHEPRGAADYILGNGVRGNTWNWYHLGSYLLWRFYPQRKVFFDGRADVYAQGLFERFMDVSPLSLQEQLRRYDIQAVVITAFSSPWVHELLQGLDRYQRTDSYTLVFFDDDAMVYLKNGALNRDLILRDGYRRIHPVLGFRLGAAGDHEGALAECRRAEAASRSNSRARGLLAQLERLRTEAEAGAR